jgi:Ca2+-binding EF-hand superfamily protein
MKKLGLIGGALIVGVVGAFASVASAQQAAPAAQQAAPAAPQAAPSAPHGESNRRQRSPTERMAQLESRFNEADKDGDGKLTLDEAEAGMPRVAKNFALIDKDKKGYVTLDEIKAAMVAMSGH